MLLLVGMSFGVYIMVIILLLLYNTWLIDISVFSIIVKSLSL